MEAVVRDRQEAAWCNGTGAWLLSDALRCRYRHRRRPRRRRRQVITSSINIESPDFIVIFPE